MKQFITTVSCVAIVAFVFGIAVGNSGPKPVKAGFELERSPAVVIADTLLEMSPLEDAIWLAETNRWTGEMGPIFGDDGDACGPLQIHYACWFDALEHDPSIGGHYRNCQDLGYALSIFRAYMDRYGQGKTDRQKARIWNGGPDGHLQDVTLNYPALEYLD